MAMLAIFGGQSGVHLLADKKKTYLDPTNTECVSGQRCELFWVHFYNSFVTIHLVAGLPQTHPHSLKSQNGDWSVSHIHIIIYIIDCFGLWGNFLSLFSHIFILGICKSLIAQCLSKFLLFNLISIIRSSGGIASMWQGLTLVVWGQFRKANVCTYSSG